jgi:Resolvase, N terminal domain
LSRDAHFLLGLQKAGVRFVAADMPGMVVGIMAAVAQAERKMISVRTKSALAAANARGVKLGGVHHQTFAALTSIRLRFTRRSLFAFFGGFKFIVRRPASRERSSSERQRAGLSIARPSRPGRRRAEYRTLYGLGSLDIRAAHPRMRRAPSEK